jgi:hypothetical protein
LLEHLKEEFDFPAVPVYLSDSGGSEAKVVGQKLRIPLKSAAWFAPNQASGSEQIGHP